MLTSGLEIPFKKHRQCIVRDYILYPKNQTGMYFYCLMTYMAGLIRSSFVDILQVYDIMYMCAMYVILYYQLMYICMDGLSFACMYVCMYVCM